MRPPYYADSGLLEHGLEVRLRGLQSIRVEHGLEVRLRGLQSIRVEHGLEVRLRGLQSIRVVGAFGCGFGFLTSVFWGRKQSGSGLLTVSDPGLILPESACR